MILQALNRYYDILAADPDCPIARQGYSTANVSFALLLSARGELEAVLPLSHREMRGKKEVEAPYQRMVVPEQVKRTANVAANFLCDNSAYVLGISDKNAQDPTYAVQRFQAFRDRNLRILDGADCPEARAVAAFLRGHDPRQARAHPQIAPVLENLLGGGNMVFLLEGSQGYAHNAAQIRQAWEASRAGSGGEAQGQCLVSGERAAIARLHGSIKGVRGAQATGATLVGFNLPAFESYNRQKGQGWNAPTGEKAAFAYTTVLNYLLSRESETPRLVIGDTTVVYWAESASTAYADVFSALFDPGWVDMEAAGTRRDPQASERLRAIARKVRGGDALDLDGLTEGLDPGTQFYVLGLAPNAARVAVRFFEAGPFETMVRRIMAHYQDMSIRRDFADQPARIPVYQLLEETVSKKSSDKTPAPLMAGALMRSILTGSPYPAALFYAIITRIRADADDPKKHIHKINYPRAAVIKAYLTRKYRNQPNSPVQEVLCMALNEQSTHPAYLLGRLFAVLEKAQTDALGGEVNATIKDRYFTTACASPATVFPVLLRLAQHHIAKAEYGYISDRRIQDILGMIQMERNPIPKHLTLDEQGIFVLGYYHQRAAFYTPRTAAAAAETTASIHATTTVEGE